MPSRGLSDLQPACAQTRPQRAVFQQPRYGVSDLGGVGTVDGEPVDPIGDGIGSYTAPNVIQLHTQVTYDVNKRVTLVGNFANIVNRCFGGTPVPWAVGGACGYALTPGAGAGPTPVGNVYNPGDYVQPMLRSPYQPTFPGFPFNMYFEARIKI